MIAAPEEAPAAEEQSAVGTGTETEIEPEVVDVEE